MPLNRNTPFGRGSKPSQRRHRPAPNPVPPPFKAGDTVAWNGRYRGVVKELCPDGTALVEDDGSILGDKRRWRLDLAALSAIR